MTSNDNKITAMPPQEQASTPTDGSTALAVTMPRSIFEMSKVDFERVQFLAKMYAVSAFNSGNDKLTEGDAFIIMMKGMELGFRPMQSMDFINVIKGKPTIDGKGMLALIRSSDKTEYLDIDSQPDRCTIRTKRSDGGSEVTVTWTMDRAKQFMVYEYDKRQGRSVAKPLTERFQWKSQPQVMLKWRAVAEIAREVYSDVIGGLYTREELSDGNIVVHDDGRMEQVGAGEDKPQLSSGPSRASSRENDGPRHATQPPKGTRIGDEPKSTAEVEHWAADKTKLANFLNDAVKEGLGESRGEAWQYISANWPGGPLKGAGDLPAKIADAHKVIRKMGRDLASDVGAKAAPAEDYWTAERMAQLSKMVKATFGRETTAFESDEPLLEEVNILAAMKRCDEHARQKGWKVRSNEVEYALHGKTKVMVFHLPEVGGTRYAPEDEEGRPTPPVAYGGRSNLKKAIGTDWYDALGVEGWDTGNTYTLPDDMWIEFEITPAFKKDGTLYFTADNIGVLGDMPKSDNATEAEEVPATADEIPF